MPFRRQPLCCGDVALPRGLVAPAEQEHDAVAALCVVDPVAGPMGQAKFPDPTTNALRVARVTVGQPVDPGQDPSPAFPVLQLAQPPVEVIGAEDLDHVSTLVDTSPLENPVEMQPTLHEAARSILHKRVIDAVRAMSAHQTDGRTVSRWLNAASC